jgi:RNA polymerase sigma-70 factor (ECF subfamily)
MDIDQPSSERVHPRGGEVGLHGERAGNTTGRLRSPAEEPSDEQLFKTFCDTEDTNAYEVLVSRYERELFSYLRRYVGSSEMAEDVFQATFLQIYVKRDRFEAGRRFRPWLYTVATNQAIDAQRRNRRHRMVSLDQKSGNDEEGDLMSVVSSAGPTAVENLEDEEAREWVRGAVDDLPETLRAALILVYHQGLKYREAADVLGIPVGTVKSRLHAALLKLNRAWTSTDQSELKA